MSNFDYFTINVQTEFNHTIYAVFGWRPYEESSVLAGQQQKVFVSAFDTEAEAKEAYPGAEISSKFTEPQVSLNHLPGENDPVPGGMYPDDWTD